MCGERRRQPRESFWGRKTSSRGWQGTASVTAARDPVRDVPPARPAESTVPEGARRVEAEGRGHQLPGDVPSPLLPARFVPPAGRVPVTDTPPSTTGRPRVSRPPPSPVSARAPNPAPLGPPAARHERPFPDPATRPPRTSRRAGGAPRSLAAAGSQSRPRSSRAGGYGGDSDPSGLHAPGGGGAGARVPALLAPRRAPGLGGGGGAESRRAPPPLRPPAQASARGRVTRSSGSAPGGRPAPPRRRVRAQPPDPRPGWDVPICGGSTLCRATSSPLPACPQELPSSKKSEFLCFDLGKVRRRSLSNSWRLPQAWTHSPLL